MGDRRHSEINKVPLPSDQNASGRTFGAEELEALQQVITSGTLTSTKGTFVKQLEQAFAELLGVKHAFACSSGTAAIHTGIAAIDPEPGDEIVTSPITDMGALTPILYQGAIPVFADVDPETLNITAKTIEPCLSKRTRAIMVTHLFGNPCQMDAIEGLARSENIPIIEDCAQAFLSKHNGKPVGTIGAVGCFSLQQGKHVTCGEGGLVVTDDDVLARRAFLFINKAWGYGDNHPDHYFLALNYRLSELQGAVAFTQMEKLDAMVEQRIDMARALTEKIEGLPGMTTPRVNPHCRHVYWRYHVQVDDRVISGGAPAVAEKLKERGIASAPRYIQKPAFLCEIFQEQRTFGGSRYPFTLARPEALDYEQSRYPGTFEGLDKVLVLPWNECYTEDHVDYIAASLWEASKILSKDKG